MLCIFVVALYSGLKFSVGDPDPDPQIRIRDPPIFTGIQIRKRSAEISADPDLRYTFNI